MQHVDINHVPDSARERLALVPAKLRARGYGWLAKRVCAETWRLIFKLLALLSLIPVRIVCFISSVTWAKDTLYAVYDLKSHPISFDVVWFLVWSDLQRRRRGLKRLQCVFVPYDCGDMRDCREENYTAIDGQSLVWRFQNICVSAAALLPDCDVIVCGSRPLANDLMMIAHRLTPRGISPALSTIYRQTAAGLTEEGANWNGLSASMQGRRYIMQWMKAAIGDRKPVVITLRQYDRDVVRNSALAEWAAFARSLDPGIYCPIIIPDTENAMTTVPGFEGLPHFSAASWNIGLRMAIYEMAYVNMFVNTGPGSLCILNRRCRYLFFKVMTQSHLASEEHMRWLGFEPNTSPSFATPFQKWVWETDDRAILRREFDAMVSRIEAVATNPQTER